MKRIAIALLAAAAVFGSSVTALANLPLNGLYNSTDLGGLTLKFMPMPMVHWPDSMFTYCPERCLLMPNDAFGQHLASSSRFADEVGLDLATEELIIYFANILMPVAAQVGKAVAKIADNLQSMSAKTRTLRVKVRIGRRGSSLSTLMCFWARSWIGPAVYCTRSFASPRGGISRADSSATVHPQVVLTLPM